MGRSNTDLFIYLEYTYFSILQGELCFYCSYFSSAEQLEVLSLRIFTLKLLITFQQMTQKESEISERFKEIKQKKSLDWETIYVECWIIFSFWILLRSIRSCLINNTTKLFWELSCHKCQVYAPISSSTFLLYNYWLVKGRIYIFKQNCPVHLSPLLFLIQKETFQT